jgi:hypothetical protein
MTDAPGLRCANRRVSGARRHVQHGLARRDATRLNQQRSDRPDCLSRKCVIVGRGVDEVCKRLQLGQRGQRPLATASAP